MGRWPRTGWKNLSAAVLAGSALLMAAPRATSQDAPPPAPGPPPPPPPPPAPPPPEPEAARAERLARARARWESLSPGERDRLLRAYEEWKRFSEEKREALRRRLDDVGGREGAGLVGSRLEEMRRKAPERLARMRMQSQTLERLVERVEKGAPERARKALEALSPEARERVRHRLGHALLSLGREATLQRHATEEEKEALRTGTPERRNETSKAVLRRASEAVLAPRREELAALPEAERRVRRAALLEEAFWNGVRERGEEIRGALGRVLQDPAHGNGRRPSPELRERFTRSFGVSPEDLGNPRAVRALVHAASLVPEAEREAFLAGVRRELQRIRALPEPDRDPARRASRARL